MVRRDVSSLEGTKFIKKTLYLFKNSQKMFHFLSPAFRPFSFSVGMKSDAVFWSVNHTAIFRLKKVIEAQFYYKIAIPQIYSEFFTIFPNIISEHFLCKCLIHYYYSISPFKSKIHNDPVLGPVWQLYGKNCAASHLRAAGLRGW